MNEIMKERFELAVSRIKEIKNETCVSEKYYDYFTKTAAFLEQMILLKEEIVNGVYQKYSMQELRKKNKELYWDILPKQLESLLCPRKRQKI